MVVVRDARRAGDLHDPRVRGDDAREGARCGHLVESDDARGGACERREVLRERGVRAMSRRGASPLAREIVRVVAERGARGLVENVSLCVATRETAAVRPDGAQRASTSPGTEPKGASAARRASENWITAAPISSTAAPPNSSAIASSHASSAIAKASPLTTFA